MKFKRPVDIALIAVFGSILVLNGFFILILGLILVSNDFTTKIGAIIILVVTAPLEFLFWKLIQSPLRRLKATTEIAVHANGLQYAGFGLRLAAGAIDMLIFMPIAVLPYFLSSWYIQKFELFFLASFLYYPYIVVMVSRYGQTIGKMVVGITVYRDDGSPVSLKAALKRAIVDILIGVIIAIGHLYALSRVDLGFFFETYREAYDNFGQGNPTATYVAFISLVWYATEFLTILCNTRRKAIHDYIGGTVVLANSKGK